MNNQNKRLAVIFYASNSLIVNIDKISQDTDFLGEPRKKIEYTILSSKQKGDISFLDKNICGDVDLHSGCIYEIKDIVKHNVNYKDAGYGEIFDEQDKAALTLIYNNPNMDHRDISEIQNILGSKMHVKHHLAIEKRAAEEKINDIKIRYPYSSQSTYGE